MMSKKVFKDEKMRWEQAVGKARIKALQKKNGTYSGGYIT